MHKLVATPYIVISFPLSAQEQRPSPRRREDPVRALRILFCILAISYAMVYISTLVQLINSPETSNKNELGSDPTTQNPNREIGIRQLGEFIKSVALFPIGLAALIQARMHPPAHILKTDREEEIPGILQSKAVTIVLPFTRPLDNAEFLAKGTEFATFDLNPSCTTRCNVIKVRHLSKTAPSGLADQTMHPDVRHLLVNSPKKDLFIIPELRSLNPNQLERLGALCDLTLDPSGYGFIEPRLVVVDDLLEADNDFEHPHQILIHLCLGIIDVSIALDESGVRHRDLHVKNVYIDSDGLVRVGDFGHAVPTHHPEYGQKLKLKPHHLSVYTERLHTYFNSRRHDFPSLEPLRGKSLGQLKSALLENPTWLTEVAESTHLISTLSRCVRFALYQHLESSQHAKLTRFRAILSTGLYRAETLRAMVLELNDGAESNPAGVVAALQRLSREKKPPVQHKGIRAQLDSHLLRLRGLGGT